jgi:hypothetical protein
MIENIMEDAMTNKRARPDLEKMISLGRKGIVDHDHMKRWGEFKKEWAEADLIIWNKLKERMATGDSGALELRPPLSPSEKEWAKKIIMQAEERNLC